MPGPLIASTPIWLRGRATKIRASLTEHRDADIAIIGAGCEGLAIAYAFTLLRKSVIVLEQHQVASGESGRITGAIRTWYERPLADLIQLHGRERAGLAMQAQAAALRWIQEVVRRERVSCGLETVRGYLIGTTAQDTESVISEARAADDLNISGVGLERLSLSGAAAEPVLTLEGQAQIDPVAFCETLASLVEERGGHVFCETKVKDVQGGSPSSITTEGGRTVRCDAIVLATNAPMLRGGGIGRRQRAYRRYAFQSAERPTIRGLVWDCAGHFLREHGAGCIVSGGDHQTGHGPEDIAGVVDELSQWAATRGGLEDGNILSGWSMQVLQAADGLPLIGADPCGEENVFLVTGDCGDRMTTAALGAELVCDLVLGRYNEWKQTYDPLRIVDQEFATTAVPEAWLIDEPLEGLPEGRGMVMHSGREPLAMYRQQGGALEVISAVCPHDGCPVRFNPFEQSWDCPGDGSRFAIDGSLLNGPAVEKLPRRPPPILRKVAVQ